MIIGIILLFLLTSFFVFVATRPDSFRYERSGFIKAPADKIFPYLNNFKLGCEWSPYEKLDLQMKKSWNGPDSGVGAIMEFDGNSNVGSGRLEILKSNPNSFIEIKLEMLRPLKGINIVHYTLKPEDNGTRFIWEMSGKSHFLAKLVTLFINCDKMIGNQFNQGIENLKLLVEQK